MQPIISYIIISAFLAAILYFTFKLQQHAGICSHVNNFSRKISDPIVNLLNKITSPINPIIHRLCKKLLPYPWTERFGGPVVTIAFILSLTFIVVCFVCSAIFHGSITPVVESIFFGTLIGSFLALITGGFSFHLTGILAAGLGSFLASQLIKTVIPEKEESKFPIIPYLCNIVFVVAVCILCSLLANGLASISSFGANLFDQLIQAGNHQSDSGLVSVLRSIGAGLLLLVLLYLGIVLIVITLTELVSTVIIGSFGVALFFAIGVIIQWITEWLGCTFITPWTNTILIIAVIAYTEHKRSQYS